MEFFGKSLTVYIVLAVIICAFLMKLYVLIYETKMSYLRDKKFLDNYDPSEADAQLVEKKRIAEDERKASKEADRIQRLADEEAARLAWMESVRQLHAEGIRMLPPIPMNPHGSGKRKPPEQVQP